MKKEVKKCIKYYLENINSDEYKEYRAKSDAQGRENHYQYIKEEKPQWKDRTDYYDDSDITNIFICDVLSNEGVGKLLKKIYSLSKKEYKVTNYYKKPSVINKYDYIHLQYSHSGYGKFAEIELLKDKYIKSIDISWVQINSYFAFFEYTFTFKYCLNDELYNQFICDNIGSLNTKDYLIWYPIGKEKTMNYLMLNQMENEYFPIICQHYITSVLYSEQGKKSQLINMICMTRKSPINIDVLYLGDFGVSYYNREKNYVVLSEFEGVNYCLYAGNNIIPYFSVCGYISKYGNEFYNCFFGNRELKMFEREFSKFSTGRKKITYNKQLKKLLNKMQSMSEIENKEFNNFYREFESKWEFYMSNDKTDLKEYHKNGITKIKEIYKDNFSYLRLLSEMNYTKSNYINSIVASVTSIIAIVISVIALLYN